jgi:hypothetical protein
MNVNAQQPLGFGAAERRFGFLQIGDERKTTPVIGLTAGGAIRVTRLRFASAPKPTSPRCDNETSGP